MTNLEYYSRSQVSQNPPRPRYKSGQVLVCHHPAADYKGLLFLITGVELDVKKNLQGEITRYSNAYWYDLRVITENEFFQGSSRADGIIVDKHWELADEASQILYGRMDDK